MLPEMPQLDGVRHSYVPVNGFRMHVAEMGASDGTPVLCMHGWPQAWWCWRKLMPVLAGAGYRVLAPDLRGHGWSETPGGGYSKQQFADDMIALLDELGLDRVHLIGHDWGGMAGFIAAIDHPERFEKYMAFGIVPPFPSRNPRAALHVWRTYYQFILAAPGSTKLLEATDIIGKALPQGALRSSEAFDDFDRRLYSDLLSDGGRSRVSQAVYRTWLLREMGPIVAGRYAGSRLSVPTRIVVGEGDPVCKPALIEGVEDYSDDVAWEVLDGVGHFVMEEAPAETAERVLAFFG